MKAHARREAAEKAMIILDHNLAVHTYFSHQLKPALFERTAPIEDKTHFDPVWMSSTYAVREIEKYARTLAEKEYYYKECAINARSPENEADEFERSFIEKLNRSPDLNEYASIRNIDEQTLFVVMRRGESMEESCLRCHSTPDAAPADMVQQYGPERSFHRTAGEVVSAVSIRIPLDAAYAAVNRLVFHLFLLFAAILLLSFAAVTYLGKRWVFDPLRVIRNRAEEVTTRPEELGNQIDLPSGRELSDFTRAFNRMSFQLRKERDRLEDRVRERTEKLSQANQTLNGEIEARQRTIQNLETALIEVKTLRGILPICSFCKKIRDDAGYWTRLEKYIHDHSTAELSHSICPECAQEHYPDLDIYDSRYS